MSILPARYVPIVVGLGLIALVVGSVIVYMSLQPQTQATQVVYGSGRIEADQVRVSAEVPGRLLENRAVEGSDLSAGALLARLDATDFDLQAERAGALRAAAQSGAAQIDSQIDLAAHHSMTARADLARYETLRGQGWVTIPQLDARRDAYVAAADQVRVLRQQRAAADAEALAAAQTLALARAQTGKSRIVAPVSGAVLERLAEPGEVLAAGQPIAILANLSTVRLKIFVSERDLGRVRIGAPVRIRVDAFAQRDFPARVARVDAQAQFTPRDVHMADERSRTVYGVVVEAPNPEGVLKPGMPADAWILSDRTAGWPAQLQVPE